MTRAYLIVVAFLVGLLSGVVLFAAPLALGNGPPVEPARGTVERRIHLTMDSRWDSDRRRAFVCREEAR